MKTTKKLLVISFFCMTLTSLFLIPIAPAQEVVYNGANTEQFPYFSIYPSEVFDINATSFYTGGGQINIANELYFKYEFVKGNNTFFYDGDVPTSQKGYGLWGQYYGMNATSGLVWYQSPEWQLAFWNESIPYVGSGAKWYFIPVDSGGHVSPFILDKVADNFNGNHQYVHVGIYYNIYSIHLWNSSDTYTRVNYSSNGILKDYQFNNQNYIKTNLTLLSQPARLPPAFSFTTESGELTVSSRHISLDLTIPSADNNNDGLPDTDYEYRVLEGGVWSDWAVVTPFVDYDIGSVSAGNYTLTVEVKSMYGVTQEQIEVEYTPSSADAIPGFSTVLIMVILVFSVSILLSKYRKKY